MSHQHNLSSNYSMCHIYSIGLPQGNRQTTACAIYTAQGYHKEIVKLQHVPYIQHRVTTRKQSNYSMCSYIQAQGYHKEIVKLQHVPYIQSNYSMCHIYSIGLPQGNSQTTACAIYTAQGYHKEIVKLQHVPYIQHRVTTRKQSNYSMCHIYSIGLPQGNSQTTACAIYTAQGYHKEIVKLQHVPYIQHRVTTRKQSNYSMCHIYSIGLPQGNSQTTACAIYTAQGYHKEIVKLQHVPYIQHRVTTRKQSNYSMCHIYSIGLPQGNSQTTACAIYTAQGYHKEIVKLQHVPYIQHRVTTRKQSNYSMCHIYSIGLPQGNSQTTACAIYTAQGYHKEIVKLQHVPYIQHRVTTRKQSNYSMCHIYSIGLPQGKQSNYSMCHIYSIGLPQGNSQTTACAIYTAQGYHKEIVKLQHVPYIQHRVTTRKQSNYSMCHIYSIGLPQGNSQTTACAIYTAQGYHKEIVKLQHVPYIQHRVTTRKQSNYSMCHIYSIGLPQGNSQTTACAIYTAQGYHKEIVKLQHVPYIQHRVTTRKQSNYSMCHIYSIGLPQGNSQTTACAIYTAQGYHKEIVKLQHVPYIQHRVTTRKQSNYSMCHIYSIGLPQGNSQTTACAIYTAQGYHKEIVKLQHVPYIQHRVTTRKQSNYSMCHIYSIGLPQGNSQTTACAIYTAQGYHKEIVKLQHVPYIQHRVTTRKQSNYSMCHIYSIGLPQGNSQTTACAIYTAQGYHKEIVKLQHVPYIQHRVTTRKQSNYSMCHIYSIGLPQGNSQTTACAIYTAQGYHKEIVKTTACAIYTAQGYHKEIVKLQHVPYIQHRVTTRKQSNYSMCHIYSIGLPQGNSQTTACAIYTAQGYHKEIVKLQHVPYIQHRVTTRKQSNYSMCHIYSIGLPQGNSQTTACAIYTAQGYHKEIVKLQHVPYIQHRVTTRKQSNYSMCHIYSIGLPQGNSQTTACAIYTAQGYHKEIVKLQHVPYIQHRVTTRKQSNYSMCHIYSIGLPQGNSQTTACAIYTAQGYHKEIVKLQHVHIYSIGLPQGNSQTTACAIYTAQGYHKEIVKLQHVPYIQHRVTTRKQSNYSMCHIYSIGLPQGNSQTTACAIYTAQGYHKEIVKLQHVPYIQHRVTTRKQSNYSMCHIYSIGLPQGNSQTTACAIYTAQGYHKEIVKLQHVPYIQHRVTTRKQSNYSMCHIYSIGLPQGNSQTTACAIYTAQGYHKEIVKLQHVPYIQHRVTTRKQSNYSMCHIYSIGLPQGNSQTTACAIYTAQGYHKEIVKLQHVPYIQHRVTTRKQSNYSMCHIYSIGLPQGNSQTTACAIYTAQGYHKEIVKLQHVPYIQHRVTTRKQSNYSMCHIYSIGLPQGNSQTTACAIYTAQGYHKEIKTY